MDVGGLKSSPSKDSDDALASEVGYRSIIEDNFLNDPLVTRQIKGASLGTIFEHSVHLQYGTVAIAIDNSNIFEIDGCLVDP